MSPRMPPERAEKLQAELAEKRARLALYIAQEQKILSDGVQAYGLGTRSITRFQTALNDVVRMIESLKSKIAALEFAMEHGGARRKIRTIVPFDL